MVIIQSEVDGEARELAAAATSRLRSRNSRIADCVCGGALPDRRAPRPPRRSLNWLRTDIWKCDECNVKCDE
jgi:hypothetical protein